MTVSVQYRLGAESDTGLGEARATNSQRERAQGVVYPLVSLFVEELDDASSGRGELSDEGSF
jgi:hypothetical protein